MIDDDKLDKEKASLHCRRKQIQHQATRTTGRYAAQKWHATNRTALCSWKKNNYTTRLMYSVPKKAVCVRRMNNGMRTSSEAGTACMSGQDGVKKSVMSRKVCLSKTYTVNRQNNLSEKLPGTRRQ